jgi:voltage-gated potassium channel
MYKKLKYQVYSLLNPAKKNGKWDRVVDYFLIILIKLKIIKLINEKVNEIYYAYRLYFRIFTEISIFIFTIEYLLRLWTCTCEAKYRHPFTGRLRYALSFSAMVDLFAFLPYYMPFTVVDLRSLRILRLLRFMRIFKLGRYINATRLISNVFKAKKEELIFCLVIIFSLILVSSSFVYFAENQAQPEVYSSIPATMWWCITTITTIGYGDIIPVTTVGKILTGFISILGIAIFALPTGILASGFAHEFQKREYHHHKEKQVCPHCGEEI